MQCDLALFECGYKAPAVKQLVVTKRDPVMGFAEQLSVFIYCALMGLFERFSPRKLRPPLSSETRSLSFPSLLRNDFMDAKASIIVPSTVK